MSLLSSWIAYLSCKHGFLKFEKNVIFVYQIIVLLINKLKDSYTLNYYANPYGSYVYFWHVNKLENRGPDVYVLSVKVQCTAVSSSIK